MPDYLDAWAQESGRGGGGRPYSAPIPMSVDRCLFWDGVHVSGPPDCPHMQYEDEMGERKPWGWTVQSE